MNVKVRENERSWERTLPFPLVQSQPSVPPPAAPAGPAGIGYPVLLDALDADQLLIRLRDVERRWSEHRPRNNLDSVERRDTAVVDLRKVQSFPQNRYSEYHAGWQVPVTDPNVNHLLESWDPSYYEISGAAQVVLEYHTKTRQVAEIHLIERLNFLRDQRLPRAEGYVHAEGVPPYPHQLVAFESARSAEFFLLGMEMGTGKTKVVIDAACDRIRKRRANARAAYNALGASEAISKPDEIAPYRMLVVAPKTICANWVLELEKHTTEILNVEQLRGNQLERTEKLLLLLRDRDCAGQVVIVNYEQLESMRTALETVGFDLMVLDESTWIKSPEAKRTKLAIAIGSTCKSRMILTGLPITKSILDLYSQFEFLSPNLLGYSTFYAYKAAYAELNRWGGVTAVREKKLPELMEKVNRFSFIIRRAQCVELPEKIYERHEVQLVPAQLQAYRDMAEELVVDLETLESGRLREAPASADDPTGEAAEMYARDFARALLLDGEDRDKNRFASARIILTKLLRLSQITSGHITKENHEVHFFEPNPKLELVENLLEDLADEDKVVIWSCFVPALEQCWRRLRALGYDCVTLYGKTKEAQRAENLRRFEKDPRCRVFISQPQSGGYGINLVSANRVIYLANDYSLTNRVQSEDRTHRIGQRRSVLYLDLTAPNTIDDIVLDAIKKKRALADTLTKRENIIRALKAQLAALGKGGSEDA